MFVLMTKVPTYRVAVRGQPGHIPMFFAGDGVWAHLYHNCGGESPLETMGLKITTGTVLYRSWYR